MSLPHTATLVATLFALSLVTGCDEPKPAAPAPSASRVSRARDAAAGAAGLAGVAGDRTDELAA
jgi:hypothetical protein